MAKLTTKQRVKILNYVAEGLQHHAETDANTIASKRPTGRQQFHEKFMAKVRRANLHDLSQQASESQPMAISRQLGQRLFRGLLFQAQVLTEWVQNYEHSLQLQTRSSFRGQSNDRITTPESTTDNTIDWLPSRGVWRDQTAYFTLRYVGQDDTPLPPEVFLTLDDQALPVQRAILRDNTLHIPFQYSGDLAQLSCLIEMPEDSPQQLHVHLYSRADLLPDQEESQDG